MKDKKKSRLLFLTVVLLLSAVVVVLTYAPAGAKPKPKGTLAVRVGLRDESFLPWVGSSGQTDFWELVYENLFYGNVRTGELIPGLAERYEYSKDYRSITLWLRKGVPWHDGWGEVTAEDVKYTCERIKEKGSRHTRASIFRRSVDHIEVVNPHKLIIHLKKPDPLFFSTQLSGFNNPFLAIVCKKYVEKVGDDKAIRHPIGSGPCRLVEHRTGGSGPCRLVEHRTGEHMKFEALEEHWRVVPEFKYFILRVVPEESTRVAMLKTGELDIAAVSPKSMADLQKAGISIVRWSNQYTTLLCFGGTLIPGDKRYTATHQKDPWTDKRVREAMNIAINREAIIKSIYYGAGKALPIHFVIKGWEGLKPIPYDPERAKRLLAEAGYPNGFSFEVASHFKTPGVECPLVVEAVAGYWSKIGLKPKIVPRAWGSWNSRARAGKTAGIIWIEATHSELDYTTKMNIFHYLNGTTTIYQSPELIAFTDRLAKEFNWEKRAAIWSEIAQYMRDNYISIPIAAADTLWATTKKVGKWPVHKVPRARPIYWTYIRHAKPLNTWRLFELD
jgi:peptide/nickel transport system substrate-binding protein